METQSKTYQANYLITDKVIYPETSPLYKKKGESFYIKNGDQWMFRVKGTKEFSPIKWYCLESNLSDGSYGTGVYAGFNTSLKGKKGELFYSEELNQWSFKVDDEEYRLNTPDSVILD